MVELELLEMSRMHVPTLVIIDTETGYLLDKIVETVTAGSTGNYTIIFSLVKTETQTLKLERVCVK